MNLRPPKFIFIIILFLVAYRTFLPKLFTSDTFRADGYSCARPKGWTIKNSPQEHRVVFISPESNPDTSMPYAIFSIYSEKQKDKAIFMEDMFPEYVSQLEKEDGQILGQGEELIDKQHAYWVLFRYNKQDLAVLTVMLGDEFNRLTCIRFEGALAKFQEYGRIFDEFKQKIKFKRIL